MNPSRRAWVAAHGGILALALLIVLVTFLTRGMFIQIYLHDYFFVTDIAWRSALGQKPHIDFPSSIGQAFYWPFQLIGSFAKPTATTVLYANLLVAGLLLVATVVTLPRRLSPLLYFLAAAAIIATPIAARNFDHFWTFSFLAPYNRWAWAILMFVGVIALIPRRGQDGPQSTALDGLILGFAMALLAYLKANHFLGACALVLIGIVARQLTLRTVTIAVGVALAFASLVEVLFHNNLAYVQDLLDAVKVNTEGPEGNVPRPVKLVRTLVVASVFAGTIVAVTWLWTPARSPGALLRFWSKPLALALLSVLVGVFVSYQNFDRYASSLYMVGLLVVAELGRRKLGNTAEADRPAEAPRWIRWAGADLRNRLAWTGILAGVGVFTFLDVASFAGHMAATRSDSACTIPALKGTPLAGVMQTPGSIVTGRLAAASDISCAEAAGPQPPFRPPADELVDDLAVPLITEAMPLLRAHVRPDDRILAFQFSNMFPAALGTPTVRDALPWWHEGRSFSANTHPEPVALLNDTTLILQSTAPGAWSDKQPPLWAIYGPHVERRFTVVGSSPNWRLWRRNDRLHANGGRIAGP